MPDLAADQDDARSDDQDDLPLDTDPLEAEEEGRKAPAAWTGWVISFSFHTLLIILLGGVYWLVKAPEHETPPVRVATIEPPPPKKEEPKLDRQLETAVELEVTAEADVPAPITSVDVPVEVSEREEESDVPEAKGREEAVADSEMGGSGAFVTIGGGGGASGMFGSRSGGGKKRAIGRFGGT